MVDFTVNKERCISCGQCVSDCPAGCIVMSEGACPTLPKEETCIQCQHCLAVCPTAALSILGVDPDQSLKLNDKLPTAESMERLIKGRRSVRNYKPQSIDPETIENLLDTAWHAPTGTNSQGVFFTVTMNAEVTQTIREKLYAKLTDVLAEIGPDEDSIILRYLRAAALGYRENGTDIILRGAPHILITSTPASVPSPKEDCVIALAHFELLAQSAGIGTVWNGILTHYLLHYFPEMIPALGVPEGHTVNYCMVFGIPAVKYHRTVQRHPNAINRVTAL